MSQYAEFRLAKKPLYSRWRVVGDLAHRTILSRTIPPYYRLGCSTFKFSECIHKLKYKASIVANRNLKVYKLPFSTPLNTSKIQREKFPLRYFDHASCSPLIACSNSIDSTCRGDPQRDVCISTLRTSPLLTYFSVLTAQISSVKSLGKLLSHSTQL